MNTKTNEIKKTPYHAPLYFLAKFDGEDLKEITDGPFVSEKAAIDKRSKYGWADTDYTLIQTENTFTKTKD